MDRLERWGVVAGQLWSLEWDWGLSPLLGSAARVGLLPLQLWSSDGFTFSSGRLWDPHGDRGLKLLGLWLCQMTVLQLDQ